MDIESWQASIDISDRKTNFGKMGKVLSARRRLEEYGLETISKVFSSSEFELKGTREQLMLFLMCEQHHDLVLTSNHK